MIRNILKFKLRYLSKFILRKYKPRIVAITGSVGKTSAKEAIYLVLSSRFKVRKSYKNYNNEIGLPLTILGIKSRGKNIFLWTLEFFKVFKLLLRKGDYPEILVLEMGADKPGDIGYFTSFIKSDVGVITAIGEIPVHIEFYSGQKAVVKEKAKLIESLDSSGFAVLNYDDETVFNLKDKTNAHILTFGFDKNADISASDVIYNMTLYDEEKSDSTVNQGISLKVAYGDSIVPLRLPHILWKQQIYSALAACAVGIAFGMNLVEASRSLIEFKSLPGRMNLIEGIKKSLIIDDSYNASPDSMAEAIKALKELPGKRKIAILGDMLEIGKYSLEAHEALGDKVADVADALITVGPRAKFIAKEAIIRGMSAKRVLQFDTSEEAGLALQNLIEEGDLILVKASRAIKMEKVIKEVMAHPEKADKLLVSA